MQLKKLNPLKNFSVTLLVAGALTLFSCQENAKQEESNKDMSQDTTHSGLEGTRDQSATAGTEVILDTSSGQSAPGAQPGSASQSGAKGGETTSDQQFISDAVAGNYGEIKAAQLAQKRSGNNEIKSIAGVLQKDHTAALAQLKQLASKKGINIPTEEPAEVRSKLSGMDSKKGSDFDKEWCEMLMDKHKATISKYENSANTVSDADLKNWINSILPKLRMHHDKLMACHTKLK